MPQLDLSSKFSGIWDGIQVCAYKKSHLRGRIASVRLMPKSQPSVNRTNSLTAPKPYNLLLAKAISAHIHRRD